MTRKQHRRWQKRINRRKAYVKARNVRRNNRERIRRDALHNQFIAGKAAAAHMFLEGMFDR